VAGACDVALGIVEHGLVEPQAHDRRDVRDEVEPAEGSRSLLVQTHRDPFGERFELRMAAELERPP
jgi:hypothetical protein